jgi:hypothetical protein
MNNTARQGGAIAAERASLLLMNRSTLIFNSASGGGAAVAALDQARPFASISDPACSSHSPPHYASSHTVSHFSCRPSFLPSSPRFHGTATRLAVK